MLSNRCCNILLLLIKSNQSLKLKDIGEEFGISERATRYDLDVIDNFLLKYDFNILTRKTSLGVSFDVADQDRKGLFKAILHEIEGTIYDTPSARLMDVIINLIFAKEHIFIDGEADRLLVSRSTMFKDFEKLKAFYNKEGDVLSASTSGYKLDGDEIAIRLQTARVVLSILEARDIMEIIEYSQNQESFLLGNKIYKLYDNVDETKFKNAMKLLLDGFNGNISDNNFAYASLALAIGMNRTFGGFFVKDNGEVTSQLADNLTEMLFDCNDSFDGIFVSRLIDYIKSIEGGNDEEAYFPDVQLLAFNLIKQIESLQTGVTMSNRLVRIVTEELVNLIFDDLRGKDKALLEVHRINQIRLYERIKKGLKPLENILKRNINDYDIARFYRIFRNEETLDRIEKRKNVIVLCPFDRTYAKIVASKISSLFDVNVFDCGGIKDIEISKEKNCADLIVSTLPLSNQDIPVIKIGARFREDEVLRLQKFLPNRVVDHSTVKSIYSILKEYVGDYGVRHEIIDKIANELNVEMQTDFIDGEEDLTIESVAFENCKSYDEAIRFAGKLMVENGLVAEDYIDQMVLEVEQSKTHMVVGDGIVLAHSQRNDLVKRVGGVLVRLNKKVKFCGENDEECNIIFAISTTGAQSHLNLLSEISTVLSNTDSLEVVRKSNSKAEILKLFSK